MPTAIKYALMILIVLAMVPPMLAARLRAVNSPQRRVHLVQDMDAQPKFRAQSANPLFADGRAARPPVIGTVARGELWEDEHLHRGVVDGQWAAAFPDSLEVNFEFVKRGRERFNIFCQPCHGAAGYGDGMVSKRALRLIDIGGDRAGGTEWVEPKSVHEQAIRDQPVGQIFNSITNGIRTMSGYGSQIPVADRWAIVAYVKALQRSQNARPEDAR